MNSGHTPLNGLKARAACAQTQPSAATAVSASAPAAGGAAQAHILRMRGLPFEADIEDVVAFFAPLHGALPSLSANTP